MNKLIFGLSVACALLLSLLATPASASEKKKVTPEQPTRPFISGVSGDSVTVTTGQSARTLTVKPTSELIVNGQKAAVSDLKVGMQVSSVGVGTDPAVISRLSVADAPAAQTGSSKKK